MAANQVVLITGASRGIGAATARLAASRGYDVAVNYLRDAKSAASVVAAVEAEGRRAVAIQGDMGIEADIERMFAEVDRSFGRLDHLVYNSGITGRIGRVETVDPNQVREVMNVNVVGAFLAARLAIPRLSRKHGKDGGSIVLLSSVVSTLGSPNDYVWYAASKGAIDTMGMGLAKELAGEGIRVVVVAPGIVDTEIHAAGGMPDRVERLASVIPMGRAGRPEEIAEAVLFAISDAASYVTGSVLRVGGGR